jgi:hypothetical protein
MDSDTTIPNDDLMNEADSIFPDSEEDVSLIDYARYHGLSKDYTCSYPLSGYHLQSYPDWECLGANNLTDFVLPDAVDLEEKWIIDRPSVIFLKQVLPVEAVPFPKSTSKRAYFKDFKIEPPLLPTDPELGQRRFMQRRIKRQNRGLRMMSQETDWQDVESAQLYWPSLNLPVELLTEIKQEKLQLGKGDILFLQQCMSSVEKPKFEEINEPPRKKACCTYHQRYTWTYMNRCGMSTRVRGIRRPCCHALRPSISAFQAHLPVACRWLPVQ